MYSTPKLSGFFFATVALVLGGCHTAPMQQAQDRIDGVRRSFVARIRPSENALESVMIDPPADQAAQVRGWQASSFVYPSGVTLAYPTYNLNYEDRPKWLANDYVYSLAAPLVLFYDVFAMPVYMVMEPPGTTVAYHGVRQPASMTLEPPLPQAGQRQAGYSPVAEPIQTETAPDSTGRPR